MTLDEVNAIPVEVFLPDGLCLTVRGLLGMNCIVEGAYFYMPHRGIWGGQIQNDIKEVSKSEVPQELLDTGRRTMLLMLGRWK